MHVRLTLALMVLWPFLASADVKWHKFAVDVGEKQTVTIGTVSMTVETRPVKGEYFPEDNLVITVRGAGRPQKQLWFSSSYGLGEVAIQDDILLLKYGVGRGTAGARVEHVKALAMAHSLEELFDVQTSYWVESRDPKQVGPDSIEYRVKIERSRDYTTFTFWTPDSRKGIPSEKIVRLKNDG
jgi:hypothetical protein